MMKAFWSNAAQIAAMAKTLLARKNGSLPACNVLALSSEERVRHFNEVGPTLRSLKKSVRELNDGLEFEFPGDRATLQLLAEWIVQERDCCRFFEITLRLEPEGGAAWLRLTGSKSMAELALSSFGIANSKGAARPSARCRQFALCYLLSGEPLGQLQREAHNLLA
jgi:hypothetical protein